jgi:hypothetical protein
MTFSVGDWVRRKPEHRGNYWMAGDQVFQVSLEKHGIVYLDDATNSSWDAYKFELVDVPMDRYALGMALQLAKLMDKLGRRGDEDDLSLDAHGELCPNACHQCTADWLRDQVMRELLSQETQTGETK